jgi:hypothetical protein
MVLPVYRRIPPPYDRLISDGGEPLNGKTSIHKIGIKAGASPRGSYIMAGKKTREKVPPQVTLDICQLVQGQTQRIFRDYRKKGKLSPL